MTIPRPSITIFMKRRLSFLIGPNGDDRFRFSREGVISALRKRNELNSCSFYATTRAVVRILESGLLNRFDYLTLLASLNRTKY